MRILFIAPYPANESPSQRYRMEHYFSYLQANNISFSYKPFLDLSTWGILFRKGNYFRKALGFGLGFLRRFSHLFIIYRYDYIYIHREASPVGPPFFEWVTAKVFKKKIIYDFDDAIWIPFLSENNKMASRLKNFGKVAKICRWSYKISAGNDYLAAFAKQHNSSVFVIPTVVNTSDIHNKLQNQDTTSPAIGWTGTFSTLKYIDIILPVLQQLQEKYSFTFVVIADKNPELPLKNYKFIKWSKESEVEDLLNFHIGVMPLYNDEISKGKCGFKAIQYMALGMPAIVSPVGVNTIIVEDAISGFICGTTEDWKIRLELLLTNKLIRSKMGSEANKKIEQFYSVQSTKDLFLKLFS
jgi:glycosyltransferase involved in cell wall biosynthesis